MIGVTSEIGRGARVVYLIPAVDRRELTAEESASLLNPVVDVLRPAGIVLAGTGEVTAETFWDGEEIPLGRL
ncbi:hypothetical protein [Amycolatopsis sp. cmx-8-4]|uniref:hypothetical protein n=1 Tax=Amycolatopsis sp. cmx-8-4 TaxID=2790947 RepID=UPI00397E47A0